MAAATTGSGRPPADVFLPAAGAKPQGGGRWFGLPRWAVIAIAAVALLAAYLIYRRYQNSSASSSVPPAATPTDQTSTPDLSGGAGGPLGPTPSSTDTSGLESQIAALGTSIEDFAAALQNPSTSGNNTPSTTNTGAPSVLFLLPGTQPGAAPNVGGGVPQPNAETQSQTQLGTVSYVGPNGQIVTPVTYASLGVTPSPIDVSGPSSTAAENATVSGPIGDVTSVVSAPTPASSAVSTRVSNSQIAAGQKAVTEKPVVTPHGRAL